jgi:hypothetical protein
VSIFKKNILKEKFKAVLPSFYRYAVTLKSSGVVDTAKLLQSFLHSLYEKCFVAVGKYAKSIFSYSENAPEVF